MKVFSEAVAGLDVGHGIALDRQQAPFLTDGNLTRLGQI